MNKIKIFSLTGLLGLSMLTAGCSDDFLEIVPESNYTGESFYSSDEAVLKAGEPLYNRAWFNFNRRAILGIGSLRANDAWGGYGDVAPFTKFQVTALNNELVQSWSSLHLAVTMSNSIIKDLTNNCTSNVSDEAKNRVLGEAFLTRGAAYFFMVRTWGPCILFEDNDGVVVSPIRPLNPEEDVLKFVIRDFRKASELLPETGSNGRVSKYAAKAMLAKALLAHSGWNKSNRDEAELAECIAVCEDVIDNSGASLMQDFYELFRYQNNNNCESLFAMQWTDPQLNNWGTKNALLSDLSFSDVCDVNCWGGNIIASTDMLDFFNEGAFGIERWKATFFTENEHYPYIKSAHGGYTYNKKWAQVKKGVLGSKEDTDGKIASMGSPLNTYIIRLADVFLTHAEACLGNHQVLTGGRGLESFNAIRTRAGVPEFESIDFWDIVRERRMEFCMEYSNWFDLVAWYRWKPQEMLNYLNEVQMRNIEIQNNGIERINRADGSFKLNYWPTNYFESDGSTKIWRLNDDGTLNPNFNLETFRTNKNNKIILNESNIFLPYPETDVLQNPYLSKAPEPYDFGDEK